jgi:signal transduction histidine kinase
MEYGTGAMTAHRPAGEVEPVRTGDGAPLVGTVHLVLAATSLLTVFIDPQAMRGFPAFAWLVFFGFTVHNVVLYMMAYRGWRGADSRIALWLDIAWYALLVYVTGGGNSLFYLFFFFSIMIASFRFGFDEGARVTLASTFLFSLTAVSSTDPAALVQVLLRAAFMLALGYMMASWGASNLAQRRELELLRDVSRLSNPRFGIDHTIKSIMERTRNFYGADTCILLTHRPGSPRWLMRTVNDEGDRPAEFVAKGDAAPPMMTLPEGRGIVYVRPWAPALHWSAEFSAHDPQADQWTNCSGDSGEQLADLLEARSYISAPLNFLNGEGRVFLVSATRSFSRGDALFLTHMLAQVVPVLENIHLLDRLASEAAQRERQTISRDLHDSTVQPYIGLSHTLSALRNKATPDNPLKADIDHLAAMAAEVVSELRRFAGGFAKGQAVAEPVVLAALRQHLAHIKVFYGLDVALETVDGDKIGDRLGAAVFQLVCEGVSNIRKHSSAQQGAIRIQCGDRLLQIVISNPADHAAGTTFTPVSIARRTAALGGTVEVDHAGGRTALRIDIPV